MDPRLDEIVASVRCRNVGCQSIGGEGMVEATRGEQIFYEEKQLHFPPNNCKVCRTAKKAYKELQEVRPTCQLCKNPFRVTYGVLIMILKNEERFEVPKECLRCRGLSPDERHRMVRENELDDISQQRRREVAKILAGDKQALARERERLVAAKQLKKGEFLRLLTQMNKLTPSSDVRDDLRAMLQVKGKDGTLLKILANSHDVGYRKVQEALANVTGGKGKMTDQEFAALPKAFHTVLKNHPSAMGIFQKAPAYRAPGMSPVHQHYEILSAAALMTKKFTTASGKQLTIHSTDRVDFGIKFPSGHAQPKQYGTKEADILIQRGQRIIGIDAKYTKSPTYQQEIRSQLNGIRNNFNNGNLHEFYYVTNKEFGNTFKKEVEKTNLELVKDYITDHNRHFSSKEGIKELAYLTSAERAAMPEGKVELSKLGDLHEYSQAVKDFVHKYPIKQVEICEHVTYPGT